MTDSNSDTNVDDSMTIKGPNKRKATTAAATKGKKAKQTKAKPVKKVVVEELGDEVEEEDESGEVDDVSVVQPVAIVAKKGRKGKVVSVEAEVEDASLASKMERLERKIVVLQKEIESKDKTYETLHELRMTKPEESEKAMLDIAGTRQAAVQDTLEKYKTENAELRGEITQLRASLSSGDINLPPSRIIPASPGSQPTLMESLNRIKELEKEIIGVEGEKEKLSSKLKSAEAKSHSITVLSDKIASLEEEVEEGKVREKKLEDQLAKKDEIAQLNLQKALKEIQNELNQAKVELAAEVDHSKSLQVKIKSGAPSSSANLNAGSDKFKTEFEELKLRFQLAEDCTGLHINSVKTVGNLTTYYCLLTDLRGKVGSLSFNIVFAEDGTLSYSPQIDVERDAELLKVLPIDHQGFMRFPADKTAVWFRKLWAAINDTRAKGE